MNVSINPQLAKPFLTCLRSFPETPGKKSTKLLIPTPTDNPIIHPIIPPKTEAKIVKNVKNTIFLGLAIMHAANNGSTGIGKKIDSTKDKPNKTLFVVLLEETSLILS